MSTRNYQWTNTQKTTGHKTILWHAPDTAVGPWDSKLNPKGQAWTGLGIRDNGAIDVFDVKGNDALFSFKIEPKSSGSAVAQNLAKAIGAHINGNPGKSMFSNASKQTAKGVKLARDEGFVIESRTGNLPERIAKNTQTRVFLKSALAQVPKQKSLLESTEKDGLDTLSSRAGYELHNWLAGASHKDEHGRLVTDTKLSEQRHEALTQNPGLATILMDAFQTQTSDKMPSSLEGISQHIGQTVFEENSELQERGASVVQRVAQSDSLTPEQRRTYLRNLDVMTQDHDPLYEAQNIKPQTLDSGQVVSGEAMLAETLKLGEQADSFVDEKRFRKSAAMMPAGVLTKTGKDILNSQEQGLWTEPQKLARTVSDTLSVPVVEEQRKTDPFYKKVVDRSSNLTSDLRNEAGRAMVEGLRLDSLPKRLKNIKDNLDNNTLRHSDVWDRPQEMKQTAHLRVLPKSLKTKIQRQTDQTQEY